jgi:PEP-CTERM motif
MKLTKAVKLGPLTVLVLTLVFGALAKADSITDTDTTVDSTSVGVDVGQGEIFTCSDSAVDFSCFVDNFTCYGWGNCSALGATGGAPTLADFLENYYAFQGIPAGPPVSTPEPGVLMLLCAGIAGIGLIKRRFGPALRTR